MNRLIITILLLTTVAAFSVNGMPLSPESEARLRAEGRLDEALDRIAAARQRGVDQPGENVLESMRQLRRDDADEVTLRVPVILVDFSDNEADEEEYPPEHYEELLFTEGELDPGSMRDWYKENSYGEVDIIGEVVGWVRLPETYEYYVDGQNGFGRYPRNAQKMARDAVIAADDDIDYSDFDNNDDGTVDALFIVHAGSGAEANDGDEDMIWSHAWGLNDHRVSLDGVWISRYTTEPDDGKIGVFGHELGHAMFGLPDLYDRDRNSAGIGMWSMMASGSWGGDGECPVHFDAWCKIQLGFIDPVILRENRRDVSIPAIERENEDVCYRLWTEGGRGDEYFLIENRQQIGFDESLPGAGLLIWHIDDDVEDQNDNEWYPDHENEGHYQVALEQADSNWDLEQDENRGDDGDPYPGSDENRHFDDDSRPNSRDYAWEETDVAVRNIRIEDETVVCNLHVISSIPGEPLIYWDFNEGEGRVAHDASGNDLDGTIVSATWNDEGIDGNSLYFDGRNDYVTLDDDDRLTIEEGFMATAWIYPQFEDEIWHDIIRHHMQTGEEEGWVLQMGGNRCLIGMVKIDNRCFSGNVGIMPIDTWTKVALAWDGERAEIWVNGELGASWPTEGAGINSRSDFCVGRLSRDFNRNNHFEGRIDEAAYYPYYDQEVLGAEGPNRPEIAVEPQRLDFGEVPRGEDRALSIVISNIGDANLILHEVSTNNEVFEVDVEERFSIRPDESREIDVTFRPQEEREYNGVLTISSNDPENDIVRVALTGVGIIIDEPRNPWFPRVVRPNDRNHSVLVRGVTFDDEPMAGGTWIGFFDPDGNLAGLDRWMGEDVGIAVWGDDPGTEIDEGYDADEPLRVRLWDAEADEEISHVTLDVRDGPENWENFGFTECDLRAYSLVRRSVIMSEGWNMISLNIIPQPEMYREGEDRGPDVVLMMDQLLADEDRHILFMIKNESGRFFKPDVPFNNIDYWDLTEGYQVRVLEDVEAVWEGDPIPPDADIPITEGWNMIAYFPTYDLPVSSPEFYGISPIVEQVFLMKDNLGRFAMPRIPFSNMPPLTQGQGYQIRVTEDVVLNYPEEVEEEEPPLIPPYYAGGGRSFTPPLQSRGGIKGGVLPTPVPTSSNMSVLVMSVSGIEVNRLDQIAAFSTSGMLVGVGEVDEDGRCGLAVWGDDDATDETEGLQKGESFRLKLWDSEEGKERDLRPVDLTGGNLVYDTDGFVVLTAQSVPEIPLEYFLSEAYPNPFNSITRITFGLPEESRVSIGVFDINGRQVVRLIDEVRVQGSYSVTWTADGVPSGVYVIRMESAAMKAARKVILLR